MARTKGVEIKGFKEIYTKLGLLEEEIIQTALKEQKKLANNILAESQKLVPIDTGTLARSGAVSTDKNTLTTTIFYDTPYARKQHEDTTLNHPNGGQAKYLERPFNEKADELETKIGQAIFKRLERKS